MLKPALILLACLLSISQAQNPQCFIKGICADSQVIRSSHVPTTENNCLRDCQNEADCSWFTYDHSLNLCLSFKNCTFLSSVQCQDCVSGEVACQPQDCSLSGFCKGTLIQYDQIESVDKCRTWCDNEPSCDFFSFDVKSGFCYLFYSCPELDVTQEDFVSGHRGCDPVDIGISTDISKSNFSKFI